MITDADIEKLKGVFATKEDFGVFATKEDIEGIREAIGDFRVESSERFESLEGRMERMEEKMEGVENKLDTVAGAINGLWTENGAGAAHLQRHDRQIAALATNANVLLPD